MAKIKNMGTATMRFKEGIIVEGNAGETNNSLIVSGNVAINLESDGESLKIIGTLDHENYIVFEQPVGSNRAYFGLDAGDNLDIVNNSNNDDINFFTTGGGSTKANLVVTAGSKVGVGKFGWAGKNNYGHGEAFPRDELDVSGSMRVSENVELMGNELVVSGTITGRYDSDIPGNALMFKNTEVYFVTTDDDVNNKVMAPDENIFFTGSIGSMNTTTKGTAVFGGDAVVSGSLKVQGQVLSEDYIMAELSIPGLDLANDTNAFTFNAPHALTFIRLDLYLDTASSSGDVTVTMTNLTPNPDQQIFSANISASSLSGNDSSAVNGSINSGDQIRFAITSSGTGAQGLRANVSYRRDA